MASFSTRATLQLEDAGLAKAGVFAPFTGDLPGSDGYD